MTTPYLVQAGAQEVHTILHLNGLQFTQYRVQTHCLVWQGSGCTSQTALKLSRRASVVVERRKA